MYRETWQTIWDEIQSYEHIVICRHVNPDPDAYGSQYALAQVIRDTFPAKQIMCLGEKVSRLGYLFDDFADDVFPRSVHAEDVLYIFVDTANTERIDGLVFSPEYMSIKIDHHPNLDKYGKIQLVDDQTCSTTAILLDIFLAEEAAGNLVLSGRTLERIYIGIVGDTGNFSYGTGLTVPFFNNVGHLFERINTKKMLEFFYRKTLEEIKFRGFFTTNIEKQSEGFYTNTFTSRQVESYGVTIDFATGLVNTMSEIYGAKVWATFCEDELLGQIRCSLRSRYIDISNIARAFGGGGHPQASGIRVKSWEEVEEIVYAVKELLKNNGSE